MSSLTYEQARDEILGVLNQVWAPTGHMINWPDQAQGKPKATEPWAKVRIFHVAGNQSSLSDPYGKRMWDRKGRLVVQISVPAGDGGSTSYALSKVVADAFEGKRTAGDVVFTETRINELEQEGDWFMVNVVTDFKYSEVK